MSSKINSQVLTEIIDSLLLGKSVFQISDQYNISLRTIESLIIQDYICDWEPQKNEMLETIIRSQAICQMKKLWLLKKWVFYRGTHLDFKSTYKLETKLMNRIIELTDNNPTLKGLKSKKLSSNVRIIHVDYYKRRIKIGD